MASRRFVVVVSLWLLASCQAALPNGVEGWSQSGRALFAPVLSVEVRAQREANLAAAREVFAEHPEDRDAAIWVGRRLGYLGCYRDAIDVYSEALTRMPGDAFLLRHRGHRYLSVREFGKASADFAAAAIACRTTPDETEPDGLPVPGRAPHSTLHFNVHYHRALVAFVMGDFDGAVRGWLDCLAVCHNDESRVAVTHWLWCARIRSGDAAGAAAAVSGITADMDIVENKSYHQLCMLYAGRLHREKMQVGDGSSGAALRFGLAHYDLVSKGLPMARSQLETLAADPGWSSFGVIAAEAELAR
ncbi:MAG: tetratricopeptide (TPR) repeat protein [Planctomycetota bacterium]|jgi:tetratricopeptide (TPR) repeat protein